MKWSSRPIRLVTAAIVAVASLLALAGATQARPRPPAVPAEIAVPAGNKPFLIGHAVGVQIYTCGAAAGGGFAWSSVPRANLYDDHGRLIVTHFAGPTWQARDGSRVVGAVEQRVTVDPTAIQWLLLSAASTASGPHGDRLAHTTFIQRIATRAGLAPAAGDCNAQSTGTVVESPYTADYVFWKKAGECRPPRRA